MRTSRWRLNDGVARLPIDVLSLDAGEATVGTIIRMLVAGDDSSLLDIGKKTIVSRDIAKRYRRNTTQIIAVNTNTFVLDQIRRDASLIA